MNTKELQPRYRKAALAVAVLAAFSPARAADDDDKKPAQVLDASVSVGIAGVTGDDKDRAWFGQYNGLRTRSTHGLLDFDYYRRNDEVPLLTRFTGFNVLGDTRELSLLWKRQGDWRFSAGYNEIVCYEPYTVNTGMLGIGTNVPQVVHLPGGPGTGNDEILSTKRAGLDLAFSKWLAPSVQLETSVRSENKDGARLFGRGFACPTPVAPGCTQSGANPGWAVLFLPEPINSNHTQVEARLNWALDRLRLSGGYYGSYYSNQYGAMQPSVPGALNNAVGVPLPLAPGLQSLLMQPIALWPDSQAHQFDVTGTWAFTPTTRLSFKMAQSHASQTQDFAGAGLTGAPAGITNLGAKVDTALVQAGITARPVPKLSLLGEVRYEDRNHNTPIASYNVIGTTTYTNRDLSNSRLRGRVQASYQISSDYRGTLGAEYEEIDRATFTPTGAVWGVSALRQKTEETSYRAELRRRMNENVSGAIAFVTSRRDGSDWWRDNSGLGVTSVSNPSVDLVTGSIIIPTIADRKRDKVRLSANWQAMKNLALQFSAEEGRDRFDRMGHYGLEKSGMSLYSVDADYVLNPRWTLNGYITYGSQKLNQSVFGGYVLAYDNVNTTVGLGVVGRPMGGLEVGGGVSVIEDKNTYSQGLDPAASPANERLLAVSGGLPDIKYRRFELRAYGRYDLSKASALRLDLLYHRIRYNDWAYGYAGVPFSFSDNTTLALQQVQSVSFLGLTYIYKWQ